MPQHHAVPVVLSAGERRVLKKRARGAKAAYRDWLRAQIVLAAATAGPAPASPRTCMSAWTRSPSGGPVRRPRAGRAQGPAPVRPPAADHRAGTGRGPRAGLPAARHHGVPLSRWSAPELATELRSQGLASPISPSSVLQILAEHPIKPWRYQSWVFPRDPDFAAKATVIVGLYQGTYPGQPLRPGDRIVSVDAKPSIQARARCHATGRPGLAARCAWNTNTAAPAPSRCSPPSTCAPGKCSPPARLPPGSPHSWH